MPLPVAAILAIILAMGPSPAQVVQEYRGLTNYWSLAHTNWWPMIAPPDPSLPIYLAPGPVFLTPFRGWPAAQSDSSATSNVMGLVYNVFYDDRNYQYGTSAPPGWVNLPPPVASKEDILKCFWINTNALAGRRDKIERSRRAMLDGYRGDFDLKTLNSPASDDEPYELRRLKLLNQIYDWLLTQPPQVRSNAQSSGSGRRRATRPPAWPRGWGWTPKRPLIPSDNRAELTLEFNTLQDLNLIISSTTDLTSTNWAPVTNFNTGLLGYTNITVACTNGGRMFFKVTSTNSL